MADSPLLPEGSDSGSAPPPGHPRKKTYERPRILSREPLEAMAATCTPPPSGFGKANTVVCSRGKS
jgi:hypothetical protein